MASAAEHKLNNFALKLQIHFLHLKPPEFVGAFFYLYLPDRDPSHTTYHCRKRLRPRQRPRLRDAHPIRHPLRHPLRYPLRHPLRLTDLIHSLIRRYRRSTIHPLLHHHSIPTHPSACQTTFSNALHNDARSLSLCISSGNSSATTRARFKFAKSVSTGVDDEDDEDNKYIFSTLIATARFILSQPRDSTNMDSYATIVRSAPREKLKGKENYTSWASRMKSDLIGQQLWRYVEDPRPRPTRHPKTADAPAEADEAFEDRIEKYDSRVHRARTSILDCCSDTIAEQCVDAYDTAALLWNHLKQYGKQGASHEHAVYLEWDTLHYNGKDLETFVELYRSRLAKLNKIEDFKVSPKHEQRKDEVSGKSKMTLDQCITDLLDEHTAQVNEGISQAMMADRVVVYVDDLLVFASLISSVDAAALLIGDRFAMRSLGPLHYYLGMRIIRDRSKRQIMIIQDGFLDSVALKFAQELAPLLPQTTPLGKTTADSLTIAAGEYEASTAIKMLYETLVGTAVWPVMISRPDCCYEVGLLCRFLKNPTPAHLDAIITVLRYLVGTKSLGMLFQGPTTGAGYTPLNPWHTHQDRRSTAVLQVRTPNRGGTVLNRSRQELAAGNVTIKWISTENQAADGLTKALDATNQAKFVRQLGLVDCDQAIASQNAAQAALTDRPVYLAEL
ncbi:unnamed protein product [Zymoseptoria tritici ST99CH_1E4]|uniref:Uncharacterized protein n=1 Tax=Zymoseptoria tritici ST99CH_1E4 TaxID=1276532 RepID=A0A2H1H972_ZYMTR|nr:unnamed protein product [Zymoseptoria tritici ST99CH_1E4]